MSFYFTAEIIATTERTIMSLENSGENGTNATNFTKVSQIRRMMKQILRVLQQQNLEMLKF